MNPFQKAHSEIRHQIPKALLNACFIGDLFENSPIPVNIDSIIREKVIESRVMVDMNIAGGMLHQVPMDSIVPEYTDRYMAVFRIPKELTQGRSISRVLAMSFGQQIWANNYPVLNGTYNALTSKAQGMLASHQGVPMTETTNIRLLSDNVVAVMDMQAVQTRSDLRCYLDHDPELTQLRSTSIPAFATLCVLATKAYIYNELVIEIGKDMMIGGREIGRMREILDSYADANELYNTFLTEKWRKISIFNDALSRQRLTRAASPAWF